MLAYDVLDDLTQVIDALGAVTKFSHDAEGNLTAVTDANGNTTSYGYDAMDRRASRTDPLSAVEHYAYDGNGNLTQLPTAGEKSRSTSMTGWTAGPSPASATTAPATKAPYPTRGTPEIVSPG